MAVEAVSAIHGGRPRPSPLTLDRQATRAATRAALLYILLAALWVVLSDRALDLLVASRPDLLRLQTLKGWLFVVVSGGLVYWVVLRGRIAVARIETQYRGLMEHLGSSVVVFRPTVDGRDFEILDLNAAARAAGRVGLHEVLGRRVTEVFPGVGEGGLLGAMARVAQTGHHERLPDTLYHDERIGSAWWDTDFYRLPGGEVVGVYADVTERHEAEESLRRSRAELEQRVEQRTAELARANQRLRELDRLKSLFIASMSHELRTPLNSIIGFTGIMLQGMAGPLNDKQRDYLRRVYGSGKHLLSLITDIIDISKIEAGHIDRHPTRFELAAAVGEALDAVAPQAGAKGIVIEHCIPGAIEVESDRRRLVQCLVNLLDNAVKYAQQGTVEITGQAGDNHVTLTVEDEGIGIADDDVPRLFQAFSRLDAAVAMRAPGTGLGLYLTRKIATEILEGDIGYRARPGGGSAFTLTVARNLAQ